ncbi:hypothetical protein [Conexibacter sp. CPCC 206217]|uniref:hypothetical protein n=1 Tax=Conexibacter sp. CPCC 206217 TaxID=3064574 RepID=UPI002722F289|nr:hypothetical protein [Conexibacter sp. CPCC 206217]MDO8209816.1 hypothetical protein [Conexibacter sp. CPCC 206217]
MLLLVLAQLLLPRLAEREVTRQLGGDGEVTAAKVQALPAVELLWRHADRVSAHVRSYDARVGDIADDLYETRRVDELDVRIDRVRAADDVELNDVRVQKRDGVLEGSAVLDPQQLTGALPAGIEGRLVPQDDGAIVVDARIAGASVRLQVVVRDGRVVARPDGLLGLVTAYPIFSDPRIEVDAISATPLPDGRFQLQARARVRAG